MDNQENLWEQAIDLLRSYESAYDNLLYTHNKISQEELSKLQQTINWMEKMEVWEDDLRTIEQGLLLRWSDVLGMLQEKDLPRIQEEAEMLLKERSCHHSISAEISFDDVNHEGTLRIRFM